MAAHDADCCMWLFGPNFERLILGKGDGSEIQSSKRLRQAGLETVDESSWMKMLPAVNERDGFGLKDGMQL